MKRTLFVFFLLFLRGVEAPAQTVVQQFAAISSGAGTVSDMDLPEPTAKGSALIAMPLLLTPGVKVVSVTDNYVYALNAPSGTHQPMLTGAKPDSNYCISMAAFKIAPAVAVPQ